MDESMSNLPIGVFDSGVGGISVLADLINYLPHEQYIYYGDSGNAPYGVRSAEEIERLSFKVVDQLLEKDIKSLVVACNTATSVAIESLRKNLSVPVVGMEPALKPAMELGLPGKIIVMATPVTLREKKFNHLIKRFPDPSKVIKLPCPGLVEIIEEKGSESIELENYLEEIFKPFMIEDIDIIVLGCTHYVFIRKSIEDVLGRNILLVDGNLGTAKQVKRLLDQEGTLNKNNTVYQSTKVKVINSSSEKKMVSLSKQLLEERLKYLNWQGNIQYI